MLVISCKDLLSHDFAGLLNNNIVVFVLFRISHKDLLSDDFEGLLNNNSAIFVSLFHISHKDLLSHDFEGVLNNDNNVVSLFQISRKDLLSHDFEGVLKYFRVQLPKRFRTEEAAVELMQTAVALKVRNQNTHRLKRTLFNQD